MKLIEALNELASRAGIAQIVPEKTGCVTLLFDNEHEVSFVPEEDGCGVCFQCEVGDASQLGPDGCRALLEASYSETDGAAFAIHRALEKGILWKRFGEFYTCAEFEKAVNGFLGVAIAWKTRFASGNFTARTETPAAPHGFSDYFLQV